MHQQITINVIFNKKNIQDVIPDLIACFRFPEMFLAIKMYGVILCFAIVQRTSVFHYFEKKNLSPYRHDSKHKIAHILFKAQCKHDLPLLFLFPPFSHFCDIESYRLFSKNSIIRHLPVLHMKKSVKRLFIIIQNVTMTFRLIKYTSIFLQLVSNWFNQYQ